MNKKQFIVTFLIIFGFFVNSCTTIHTTKDMANELQKSDLYVAYDTELQDYRNLSKCSNLSVKIVNTERSNYETKFCSPDILTHCYVLNPKEINYYIVNYMIGAYRKRGVMSDQGSEKVIRLLVPKVEMRDGYWFRSANLKVRVEIPELEYSEEFTASERSGGTNAYRALAHSIHVVTQKIVEDRAIKNYVLCQ